MDQNKWVEDSLHKLNPEAEWQPQPAKAFARLERLRTEEKSFRWPRTLAVAIVVAVCLLTFPQPRVFAQRILTPCVEACESLVLGQVDFHDELHQMIWTFHSWMGLTAPNFKATDVNGASFELSDYAGKVVLLNFWASWCEPCKKEIPWLVEFQRQYGKDGFAVVGISMDETGWKAVRPVIDAQKINYRVAIGDDALAKKYGGVGSLPESLLIDGMGIVRVKHKGITDKIQYEREIVRMLWKNLSDADRDRLRAQGL